MNSSSRRNYRIPSLWKLCLGQLATAGLLAIAIPHSSAIASTKEFQICAAELLRSELSRELASAACAEALDPQDLSLCVLKIKDLTPINANEALVACRRVRRPLELASCVVNIKNRIEDAEVRSVLDNCRRSLLPLRFSDCVIGLSSEIDFSPPRALTTCISTEDFSR